MNISPLCQVVLLSLLIVPEGIEIFLCNLCFHNSILLIVPEGNLNMIPTTSISVGLLIVPEGIEIWRSLEAWRPDF